MADPRCTFHLMGQMPGRFECDLPLGHAGSHTGYCADGESCDVSQPEPEEPDGDYITETVKWSVRWPEES